LETRLFALPVPARRTSCPTIKQPVDIGKIMAGLQQKNSDKRRAD